MNHKIRDLKINPVVQDGVELADRKEAWLIVQSDDSPTGEGALHIHIGKTEEDHWNFRAGRGYGLRYNDRLVALQTFMARLWADKKWSQFLELNGFTSENLLVEETPVKQLQYRVDYLERLPMIEEYIDSMRTAGFRDPSDATKSSHRHVLQGFLLFLLRERQCDLSNFKEADVKTYFGQLQEEGKSEKYLKKVSDVIRKYVEKKRYDDGIQPYQIPYYFKRINTLDQPDTLSKEQVEEFLLELESKEYIERDSKTVIHFIPDETYVRDCRRDYCIALLIWSLGLKPSEITEINLDDITMEEEHNYGSIFIKSRDTEGQSMLPLKKELRQALTKYLFSQKKVELDPSELRVPENQETGPLFISNRKKRISIRTVQRVFEGSEINPTNLRHTFLQMLSEKADPAAFQTIAGLTGTTVLKRYQQPMKRMENPFYRMAQVLNDEEE